MALLPPQVMDATKLKRVMILHLGNNTITPVCPERRNARAKRRNEGKGKLYQMLQLNGQPLQFSSQKISI